MSIRAAQNPYYESALPRVTAGIRANRQFHESFADGGVFPADFIQQLEVAEMSGTTTESLLRLAKEYEDRARTAMQIAHRHRRRRRHARSYFGLFIFAIFSLVYQVYFKPMFDALDAAQSGIDSNSDPGSSVIQPKQPLQRLQQPVRRALLRLVAQRFQRRVQQLVDQPVERRRDLALRLRDRPDRAC